MNCVLHGVFHVLLLCLVAAFPLLVLPIGLLFLTPLVPVLFSFPTAPAYVTGTPVSLQVCKNE